MSETEEVDYTLTIVDFPESEDVLYVNNLPETDEGHNLKWTYELKMGYDADENNVAQKRPAIVLDADFYTGWYEIKSWTDDNFSEIINKLLNKKRSRWRKLLRTRGPVGLKPAPNGDSVYTYREK